MPEEPSRLLPVDIKLVALTDWLRVRRIVKPDWILAMKKVRKKVAAALQKCSADDIATVTIVVQLLLKCTDYDFQDMPEDEGVRELLSHTQITYYQAVEIVSILKKTEQDTKNFLGFYSSQRMKDWKEIVHLFEMDNLYLADTAFVLNQLVKFELFSLKKDLIMLEKRISEQARKIEKNEKLAGQQEKLFQDGLQARGLQGKNLQVELLLSTNSLMKTLDLWDELILKLAPAVEYYEKMKESLTRQERSLVPLLRLYLSQGRKTTAFEWIYGSPPDELNKCTLKDLLGKISIKEMLTEEEIDFNLEDIGGIELVEEEEKRRPTVEESLTLLENKASRRQLLAEVQELRCFLTSVEENDRREHPADLLVSRYFEQDVDIIKVYKWNATAGRILEMSRDPVTLEHFDIRYHLDSLDEIVNEVEAPKKKAIFYRKCAKAAAEELDILKEDYTAKAKIFVEVRKKTDKLERRLCEDLKHLTERCRPVHLVGGLKSVVPL